MLQCRLTQKFADDVGVASKIPSWFLTCQQKASFANEVFFHMGVMPIPPSASGLSKDVSTTADKISNYSSHRAVDFHKDSPEPKGR